MKPDYQIKNVKLYNCDNMIFMKEIPDNYYNLAIVDPPYGIGISNVSYLGNTKNDERWNNRENGYRHEIKDWDNAIPDKTYFSELIRISKNQIIWGGNYFNLQTTKSWIVWDKKTSGNYADGELAWTSFNCCLKIFRWLWN